jgi:hypothetical protein
MVMVEEMAAYFTRLDAIREESPQTFLMSKKAFNLLQRISRRPKRLRGVELMRKVRKAWPIWTTMRLQGRARALPHEASRIRRREEMKPPFRRRG